jgi:hypothetical protein
MSQKHSPLMSLFLLPKNNLGAGVTLSGDTAPRQARQMKETTPPKDCLINLSGFVFTISLMRTREARLSPARDLWPTMRGLFNVSGRRHL